MKQALFTIDDTSRLLAIGKTTLRQLIKEEQIRVIRIGHIVRISSQEIERWIRVQQAGEEG